MSGAAALTDGGTGAAASPNPAGTTVAPATTAVTPSSDAGSGAVDLKWLGDAAPEDVRGYVGNKGWRNPNDVIDGYRNLEKLVGSHRLALPKDENDAEGWNKTYDALGRPKTPAEYKIDGGDPAFTKVASDWMHKAGLNTRQAQALAKSGN